MRTLIAATAALLAVGAASPALAASIAPAATHTGAVLQLPAAAPTLVQAKKKKKKKKKTSESAEITEIGNAKRGKADLEIKATVAKEGRTCELTVKYKGGATADDDSTSDADKICEFSIEVPNDSKVVGEATAELTVKDSSGKKVATAKKTFTVK